MESDLVKAHNLLKLNQFPTIHKKPQSDNLPAIILILSENQLTIIHFQSQQQQQATQKSSRWLT